MVCGLLYWLYSNLMAALSVRFSNPISFDFLGQIASFDIKEFLIPYSRTSSYGRAFVVGLLNTLIVAGLGVVFATILGVTIGVMRLSTNFLVNRIAGVYIDTFRNIPLLLLLIFWSQGVNTAPQYGGVPWGSQSSVQTAQSPIFQPPSGSATRMWTSKSGSCSLIAAMKPGKLARSRP